MVFLSFYLNTKEWKIREKHPKTQHTRKRRKVTASKICVFGCVAFSGVSWCPLRGEQRASENATHPKTQIFGAVTFLRFRVCCVFGCFLAPSEKSVTVVSIKFPPAILGPEMAAPILWAPGIFWFFLLENLHAHKIPPFRGGGGVGFSWKGGWKCQFIFMGAGIFLIRSFQIRRFDSRDSVR